MNKGTFAGLLAGTVLSGVGVAQPSRLYTPATAIPCSAVRRVMRAAISCEIVGAADAFETVSSGIAVRVGWVMTFSP